MRHFAIVLVGIVTLSCSDAMVGGTDPKRVARKARGDVTASPDQPQTDLPKAIPAPANGAATAGGGTTPGGGAAPDGGATANRCATSRPLFDRVVVPALQSLGCSGCHSGGELGSKSAFVLSESADANYNALVSMSDPLEPGQSRYLLKAQGLAPHGGGVRFSPGAPEGRPLVDLATALANDLSCSSSQAGTSMGPHDSMSAGIGSNTLIRAASFGEIFGARRSPVAALGGIRRLTSKQIARSMKDLFGITGQHEFHQSDNLNLAALPVDVQAGGFRTSKQSLEMGLNLVETMINGSSGYIFYYGPFNDPILSPTCFGKGYFENDNFCIREFIARKGRLVFRRSLSMDEQEGFKRMYDGLKAMGYPSRDDALRWVIRSWVVSPNFLYRSERGTLNANGSYTLKGVELASALSFLLWNSTPDHNLLLAAEAGDLEDTAKRNAQVVRMIRDPRGRAGALDFFSEWAEIDQAQFVMKELKVRGTDTSDDYWRYKGMPALKEHANEFFAGLLEPSVDLPKALVGRVLVPGSGIAATEFFSNPTESGVPERRGFLMHPLFLAVHSHLKETGPVLRGRFVREKVLCEKLPLPPPGVETALPAPAPGISERARLAAHSTSPTCAGCHNLIDDLGFALESFDVVGRYRSAVGSLAIDAKGVINYSTDANGSFSNPWEFSSLLAASTHVEKCFVYSLQRYALGREVMIGDANSLQDTYSRSKSKGMSYEEIMQAMTSSPAFLERSRGVEQ